MRRKRTKGKGFKSEAQLCADFLALVKAHYRDEWQPYAETAGWDILLVRVKDGFQIGIQAKLTFNIGVINQCLEQWYEPKNIGPDCRAILVPHRIGSEYRPVCQYLGLTIISVSPGKVKRVEPKLPTARHGTVDPRWHEWWPLERHPLPCYVPDVVAGASSPVQLTHWKIKALKLAALLEARGFVLRSDFQHLGLDPRRWTVKDGWLATSHHGYVAGKHTPDFAKQHPIVYAQIKSDFGKWAPPDVPFTQAVSRGRAGKKARHEGGREDGRGDRERNEQLP